MRSQHRDMLIKVFEVRLNWQNDKEIICNSYTSDCCDYDYRGLGTYASKERALEVLDEIQKLIKPTLKINYEYDDSQPIIDGEWLKPLKAESKIEELSCYVYEMPQE